MSPLRLAIFDIDGTLTDTNAVDDRCFTAAVADVLELRAQSLDWSEAPHITDSAIAPWCCERFCGRPLSDSEYQAIVQRFLALLSGELARDPAAFAPIPGAPQVVSHLRRAGWAVALATGGWGASARLKLDAAGIDTADASLSSADDGHTREEILRCALRRAAAQHGRDFDEIVSLGDGVWDVRAAAQLSWRFVGIASASRGSALNAAGATVTLEDFTDPDRFLSALARASVPSFQ